MAATVADLWSSAVARPPAAPAYLTQAADRTWAERSWDEAAREVDELAAGFVALGIRAPDRVAIIARTRLEWALCDWALIAIGALVVPIYPTSSAIECAYILGNSGARFLVCEDDALREKLEPVRRELEALEQVVLIEDAPDSGSLSLEDVRARGRAYLEEAPDAVEQARTAIGEDDPLTIVYTSGTTGPPKGCVLSQRNYRAMVEMVLAVEGLVEPGDRLLLHLPLAHTFARLISFLAPAVGLTIAFCPDSTGLTDALTTVRPTLFPSVPRLYEKIAAGVHAKVEQSPRARRAVAQWAIGVGARASALQLAGQPLGPSLAFERVLADRLVLSRLRAGLGGQLRFAVCGGAPLPVEVAEFFHGLGIVILEGYGLTESTTAVAFNRPDAYRLGSVGLPLPGVELRLAPDGEIFACGPNIFQGYYRDEDATRAVLSPDGWLATGDLGAFDADGFLTITGRKKEIIVTANGENVAPQRIEDALKTSRYISEAVVIGDRRPYLVALLVLDQAEVEQVARGDEEVRELVEGELARVNQALGRRDRVRRFAILTRDLSQEASELTPTLKVRRHVCEEHFRDEIERLYLRV
ncbi:MAG TPA: long-chain fatty acid--CoA ligase [Gaiellaceae bacterium]|nr:long-chain fatty acid--CoA ligase [Gaiellaceae bacterium]